MTARTRSISFVVAGSLAWAVVAACNQQTINTPLRSFDRPSDVALTCVQFLPGEEDADSRGDMASRPHGIYEVRPLADCEPVRARSLQVTSTSTFVPPLGPGGPFTPFLVALVAQSARGELALVDTAAGRLIDTDPYKPGYGFVPVGKLPEHIRASKDGCWAVTANSGSCDLSKVDVSKVLHSSVLGLFPGETMPGAGTVVAASGSDPLPLTVPSKDPAAPVKTLYARPSWIEMAPENDAGGAPSTHGYEPGGTLGTCTGGAHRVWVALPACQLVVKVRLEADANTPSIEAALHVDKSGVKVVSDLSTLDCPVECAGPHGDVAPADLGPLPPPSDGGVNLPTSQAWPSAIAVDVESDVAGPARAGRLVIGDGFGERIDIVPFDITAATFGAVRSITLDPGDTGLLQPGVRVVRTSPRSEAGKFLYAVARDGSVRVIDLDRNAECETNPDPRWNQGGLNLQQTPTRPDLNSPWSFPVPPPRALGCFPLGDPATPRRSPFAHSPGIALASGQLPVDVAFVHLDAPPDDPNGQSAPPAASPGLLVGDFAWIISSDGRGTVVDIYDACPAPNQQAAGSGPGGYTKGACIVDNVQNSLNDTVKQFGHPQPMLLDRVSHRIRTGHPRFILSNAEGDNTGQPRVPDSTLPCAVAVPTTSTGTPDGGVPDAGGCGTTQGNLPGLYLEPVPAPLAPILPNETRAIYFVDPDHVRTETWVLTWEGVLPGTSRPLGFPFVIAGADATQNGAYLTDNGGAWCGRGVRAGDKLVFTGCSVDTECDQAAGYQCVHDPGAFIDVTQGLCLPVDNTRTVDYWSQRCGKLLRAQRKFSIVHARQALPGAGTIDTLTLGEIYEPEYAEQTHTCGPTVGCGDVQVVAQVGGATKDTACLQDSDGQHRCLLPCDGTDNSCGADFECALSVFGDLRCMRAPIGSVGVPGDSTNPPRVDPEFWTTCMPEAQQYEIHAGDAFTVSGTQSGLLSNETVGPLGECILPPQTIESARLSQWRLPLTADRCPPNVEAQPLTQSIDPSLQTNVCAVQMGATSVRRIHYENPIYNIVAQVPLAASGSAIVPPDGTSLSFSLTGGGNNLITQLGVDVQAQQPRAAIVAPDGQTLYIIDEGKSPVGAGLRGQMLRLFSASQSVDTTFVVR